MFLGLFRGPAGTHILEEAVPLQLLLGLTGRFSNCCRLIRDALRDIDIQYSKIQGDARPSQLVALPAASSVAGCMSDYARLDGTISELHV